MNDRDVSDVHGFRAADPLEELIHGAVGGAETAAASVNSSFDEVKILKIC